MVPGRACLTGRSVLETQSRGCRLPGYSGIISIGTFCSRLVLNVAPVTQLLSLIPVTKWGFVFRETFLYISSNGVGPEQFRRYPQ